MIATQDIEAEIASTAIKYDELVQTADTSTKQILKAIQSENIGWLNKLIEERGELYREIGLCVTKYKNLLSKSDLQGSPEMASGLQAGKKQLLQSQANCECALSTGLGKYKAELINLNQSRNLRNAYQRPASTHQARFIDNRL